MLFLCKELTFQTKGKKVEYFNVKTNIDKFIKESKLRDGILLVQTPHTTCSVILRKWYMILMRMEMNIFKQILMQN